MLFHIDAPDLSLVSVAGATLELLELQGFSVDGQTAWIRATFTDDGDGGARLHSAIWTYDLHTLQYGICLNASLSDSVPASQWDVHNTAMATVAGQSNWLVAYRDRSAQPDQTKLAWLDQGLSLISEDLLADVLGAPVSLGLQNWKLSDDGRFLAIQTESALLAPENSPDTNDASDIYLIDLLHQRIERVSQIGGAELLASCVLGDLVVIDSQIRLGLTTTASLSPNDQNTSADITLAQSDAYVWTRSFDAAGWMGSSGFELVSVATNGRASGDVTEGAVWVAKTGTAFESAASNLVTNDHNSSTDVFLRTSFGVTQRVTLEGAELDAGAKGADFSTDGRTLLVLSDASAVAGSTGVPQLLAWDTSQQILRLLSSSGQVAANDWVLSGVTSADGGLMAFTTAATNLGNTEAVAMTADAFLYSNGKPITDLVLLSAMPEDGPALTLNEQMLLSLARDPEGAQLSVLGLSASSGVLTQTQSGVWNWDPDQNDASDVTFSYFISDGFHTAAGRALLDLLPVNDAPQLAQPLPDVRAQASAAFVLVLPAGQFTDPDGDGLQRQVLQADGSALPAWLVWDAETQSMRMAAGQGVAGEYALKVVAGDGSLSASDPFVLTLTSDAFAVSGLVQDGYVAGARIYVDRNGDGVAQDSEDTGLVTDSQGRFAGQISGIGPLIALGGTNLDTGLRNLMPLRAPEGAGVISPVTTLVQAMVDQGQGLEAAQQRVLQVFGLRSGLNLLQFDPLADSAPLSDALSVQKLNVQVALAVSTVSQVAGGAQALTQSLAQAVVADPDARLDLGDGGVLQQVLSAALAPTQVSSAVAQLQGAFEQVAQSQSLGQVAQSQQAALLDIAQQHQIDLAAPVLQSSSPSMGAREVLPGAHWVLTYNEAIGLGSGAIEVIDVRTASVLRSVPVGDPTQVQVSGSTLTLNLSSDLAVGTTYALRLPAGAVQDLAGNAAAPARGLFTTAGITGGLLGSAGNDHLVGTAGADRLQPGLGSDTVDGGLGQDTVVLPLYANAYKNWQAIEGGYRVEVNTGHTLTLKGIETIELGNEYVSSIPVARFVSGEAQDQLEKLTDLYLAFYGRAPDVGGLAYWQERNLEEGRDFRLISQDFAWARETERLFPQGASNEVFITAIYQNCFNRAPDPAGLAYWAEVLKERLAQANSSDPGTDRNIRGDFVCELILGAYAVTSGPEDQGLLTNKHEVALDYVSRLSGQTVLDFENEAINALLATVTLQASTREAALDALAHVFDERPYDAQVSLTGVMNDAGLLAQLGVA